MDYRILKSQSENETDYIGKLLEMLIEKDSNNELVSEVKKLQEGGNKSQSDYREIWTKKAFQNKVNEELFKQIKQAIENKDLSPIVKAIENLAQIKEKLHKDRQESSRGVVEAVKSLEKPIKESKPEPLDLKPLYKVLKEENTKTGRMLNKILRKDFPEPLKEIEVKEPNWISKLIPEKLNFDFLKKWTFKVKVENEYSDKDLIKVIKALDKTKDTKEFQKKLFSEWLPRLVPSFPTDGAKDTTLKEVKTAIENQSFDTSGLATETTLHDLEGKDFATSAKQDEIIAELQDLSVKLGTPTTTNVTLTNADTDYKLPSSEKEGRRSIIVSNNSAYDVYLGQTGVIDCDATTPIGILLPAGGSITLDCSTGLYAQCDTAGVSLTVTEF